MRAQDRKYPEAGFAGNAHAIKFSDNLSDYFRVTDSNGKAGFQLFPLFHSLNPDKTEIRCRQRKICRK
jgi:hypothetical protein